MYDSNPLIAVTCQLTFTPVLKIETEVPAEFQERVRATFPSFAEQRVGGIDLPEPISKILQGQVDLPVGRKAYVFESPDKRWRLTLARDHVALLDRRYTRWEHFRANILVIQDALATCYSPAYFTRIGLRYQNAILRSHFGERPWNELLQPYIAGELLKLENAIEHSARDLIIKLDDDQNRVHLQHGLAVAEQGGVKEPCYIIDSDFYREGQLEGPNAIETLNNFNAHAARLFRWCITDTAHDALGPTPLPD